MKMESNHQNTSAAGLLRLSLLAAMTIFCGIAPAKAVDVTPLGQGQLPTGDNIFTVQVTLLPGEEFGWHYHTGRAWGVIVSGVLTEDEGCGAELNAFLAGQALAEEPGRLYTTSTTSARNRSSFCGQRSTPPVLTIQKWWPDRIAKVRAEDLISRRSPAAREQRPRSKSGPERAAVHRLAEWAAAKPEPLSGEGAGFGTLALESQMLTVRIRFSGLSASASAAQMRAGPEQPVPMTLRFH